MPEFRYRGMLRNGKTIRGVMTARNKRDVIKNLKTSRIQPIRIRSRKNVTITNTKIDSKKLMNIQADVERTKVSSRKPVQKKGFGAILTSDISFGISNKDILTFTNNLYILKKAKFNNIDAFESLYGSTENSKLRDIIDDILIGIEGGYKIHEMMQMYPKVFPPLYTNFVRVGEESGSLDKALLYARDYVESDMKLKKQIRGILIPKVLMFVGVLIITVIALLWGTPLIQNVYDMFGSDKTLPKATLVAIDVSKWILANWYIVVTAILGIIAIFIAYVRTPLGRYQIDRIKIRFPVFGRLTLNIITNKFFRAMLLNIRNGLRIQEALDVAKSVTDNYYFLSLVEIGKGNLLAGGSWVEPFEAAKALPPIAIQMINIGMKSDLAEMMEKVSEYIQQEIDEAIAKTVKALPEIMYIFIGIILIFFVITIMVPLMEVYMGNFLFDMM
ncbi:MAG: type II secretion system F family protein [Clostridia bacterium]|nr:type II secretion system F family protein [Clostridia bacterium]